MLTIDELAAAIRSISPEEPAQRLADLLSGTRRDNGYEPKSYTSELRIYLFL
jgi:hypothetical protein